MVISAEALLVIVLVGLTAGWLAGQIVRRVSPDLIPGAALICDVVALFFSTLAAHWLLASLGAELPVSASLHAGFMALFATIVLRAAGAYSEDAILKPRRYLELFGLTILGLVASFIAVAHLLHPFDASRLVPTTAIVPTLVIAAICAGAVTLARTGLWVLLEALAARGVLRRQVVVLDCGMCRRGFMFQLEEVRPRLTCLTGVFDLVGDRVLRGKGRGLDELVTAVRCGQVDDVILTIPRNASKEVLEAIQCLRELPVNIHVVTETPMRHGTVPGGSFSDLPLRLLFAHPMSGWGGIAKYLMDVALAGAITVLISPLLLMIAVAIKIDSPGPIFFKQKRIGLNNREFTIWKFRSMYFREAPAKRIEQVTRDDPRVTPVGKILRRTSLDELPQLFNVLNGTMSLVGPRPHALSHDEEYGERIAGYVSRHRARPGITGWAQVNGLRGETEELQKMVDRVHHDCFYIDHWSPFLDIKILFMTVLVVFFQDTAY